MPTKGIRLKLWALLLVCRTAITTSNAVEHSDLKLYTFSSLLKSSDGETLSLYPEGMRLDQICQSTVRNTYWYERRPPNTYPDPAKDKLPSISSNPVPSVTASIYTIKSLSKEDDGRELWCTMDGSSVKKVVTLRVVGPPAPPDIHYTVKGDILEIQCESKKVNPKLELCWYRFEERRQCMVPATDEESSTTVTMFVPWRMEDGREEEIDGHFVCKARLKEDRVLETLTKDAQDRFADMLQKASVKLEVKGRGPTDCHDAAPTNGSASNKTFTLQDPNSDLCRKVDITERRMTTPAPLTTRPAPQTTTMATTATSNSNEEDGGDNGGSSVTTANLLLLLTLFVVFLH